MLRGSAILLSVLVLASAGWGSAKSPLNVDFFCGWDSCYRPMEWTPVEIGITSELTKPFAGSITVSAQQDGLNTLNIIHDFVLTPDIPLHLPLVTKFAYAIDKCSVRIRDRRGRERWHHDFELLDFSRPNRSLTAVRENELLIGLVGAGKFGLLRLPDETMCEFHKGEGKVYLKTKVPRMVPWDWTGFASLDLLILYDPDWSLFNRQQLAAVAQWVSNGGKLFLILGSHPLPAENPIAGLLPFEVQEVKEVTIGWKTLEQWDLSSGGGPVMFGTVKRGEPETVTCWPLVPKAGARLYEADTYDTDECLFGTGYVGFGRVGVLAFEPSTLSDKQKANSARFWVGRIAAILDDTYTGAERSGQQLSNRNIKFVGNQTSEPDRRSDRNRYEIGSAQSASNVVMEYLYSIPEMRPLSILWVILLLTALAVLLGPVDYKLLKRWGRLPLTWLTCAGWIVLFTVGAYYGVQALRGGKMQLRVVSVMDGIEDSDCTWSTDYCGLFAPYSDNFKLEGLQDNQWWSGIAPSQQTLWAYNLESGRRRVYSIQHDGGNLPASLPINIWTIQCLLNESALEELPFSAEVERRGNNVIVKIVNESDSQILRGYALFKNDQGIDFGLVPALSTKEFSGPLRTRRGWNSYFIDNRGRRYRQARFTPRLKNEDAFFAQGCFQRTQTISAYLARGAAVVCAEYDNAAVSFKVKDRSCNNIHIQLVRQIVFPKEQEGTTDD
jgi:hypothetical protein